MKLLIAEDDLTSRSILTAITQKWGYDPIAVGDGEAAWQIMLGEEPPRLLLLDWEMPKMDGLTLCQQIRQQENGDPPFIVMLTSRRETSDIISGLESGANDYIAKPFVNAELQARLQVGKRMLGLQSKHRQAEEALQLAASVFTHTREGIIITDAHGSIIDVNRAFTQITGYSQEDVLGENPRMFKSDQHGLAFYATIWRDLLGKGHWSGEVWNRRKNGELYAELRTISAVLDEEGMTQHYVTLFSDITEQKEYEQQLEHSAQHDALTKLPNRLLLTDRLQNAISQVQRRKHKLAVVYIDLDGFKKINDTHGHDAGDQLLVTMASRMQQVLRECDTIARMGGDEFAAVLSDLMDVDDYQPILERLLEATAKPVYFGEHVLQVSASIGVTIYPQAEEMNTHQLLRQADYAMYQAKLDNKNSYHIFDAEQARTTELPIEY